MPLYLDAEEPDGTTPPDYDQVQADLELGLKELRDAHDEYKKAEQYFLGEAEEKFISDRLRKMLTGSTVDFYVNLAGRVVYAVTDRLEIAAVTALEPGDQESNETEGASGGDSESYEDNDVTTVLNDRVWHHNEMDIEVPDVHEKATYFGDAYVYVGMDRDEENVNVFYNSPLTTRAIYDDENPREMRFLIKSWQQGTGDKARVRVNIYYPYFHFKFITKTDSQGKGSKGTQASDYEPHRDEFTDTNGMVEYPYPEIPFFHFRTARPYGRPEHKGAYGPQDAITKLISGQMVSTDFAAYPQRWALSEEGTSGTDDDIDWGDDDSADPDDRQSSLVSGPGRVWMLDKVKAVGQFQTSDPDAFLKPLDKFIELMGSATGTPLSYLHKVRGTSSTPLSGASQKQTEVMLLKKIQSRQRSYGATWRAAFAFAMKLLGYEDVLINVQWAAASQVEKGKEVWDGVLAQQSAGVPTRQTLLEQDYTDREVTSWGYTEDQPNGDEPEADDPFARNAQAPLPENMEGTQFDEGNRAQSGSQPEEE